MVSVKLIRRSSGNPIEGTKVALGISELLRGGVASGVHTDARGDAHFDIKPGQGKVFRVVRSEYIKVVMLAYACATTKAKKRRQRRHNGCFDCFVRTHRLDQKGKNVKVKAKTSLKGFLDEDIKSTPAS